MCSRFAFFVINSIVDNMYRLGLGRQRSSSPTHARATQLRQIVVLSSSVSSVVDTNKQSTKSFFRTWSRTIDANASQSRQIAHFFFRPQLNELQHEPQIVGGVIIIIKHRHTLVTCDFERFFPNRRSPCMYFCCRHEIIILEKNTKEKSCCCRYLAVLKSVR